MKFSGDVTIFKDQNGHQRYFLATVKTTNSKCEADDICRNVMPNSLLARLEDEASRDFINKTLSSYKIDHNVSHDMWIYGSTSIPDSHRIDPAVDLLLTQQGNEGHNKLALFIFLSKWTQNTCQEGLLLTHLHTSLQLSVPII